MSKAQRQFTIIDYNDALTLTGYIGSNLAKTQMFNPDNSTYSPLYKATHLSPPYSGYLKLNIFSFNLKSVVLMPLISITSTWSSV